MNFLYQVTLKNFCAGAIVNQLGIVTEYAPILRRFGGQHISRLREWVKKNQGTVWLVSSWE